ncbi:hypothetical protein GCM10022415_12510 [Knoellia locipacati]|uniref:Uncharacterized protein n=1 Tax=Knoellia locipacati TaxID=882824 RepID=A0A512SZ24_9MICO|nr:hypothetical protein [Knoellia locipacati]GEQ13201.1 hypothetical protein KLO01_12480 [Knoellia locipacati]
MSTPDDDTDPTGMRALLRGLPDPGPMPDDLVARIQSSLADLPLPEARPGTSREDGLRAVSRGTESAHGAPRPSWWARNGSRAAVAAVVLLGGGAVASDQLGLLGSGGDSASSGTTADSSAGGSPADQRAEGPTDGDESGPQSGSDNDGRSAAGPVQTGQVVVTKSGRTYTAGGLATEVDRDSAAAPTAPLTAESPGIGPIGTEIGVRSCLVALGLPRNAAARVDLALVDATPAAVLVVTRDGGRTAYAVGRDCTLGNPSLIAGPIQLP